MSSNIIDQSFQINLRIMELFYLYPSKKPTFIFSMCSYLTHILFVIPVPTLSILYLLLSEKINVEKVKYNAAFVAQTTCFITKLLPFITHAVRIKKCIRYFEEPCFIGITTDHKDVVDDCIRICRRNTTAFLICAVGAVGSWATKPFFWQGNELPVDIWLPYDFKKTHLTYYVTYFFTTIGPIISSLSTGVIDPLIAGLAFHATTQIKILRYNLQHLSDGVKVGNNNNLKCKEQYEYIKQCIKHYSAVFEFTKEYEQCFSLVIFSQIAASVFVICFCCLELSRIETFGYNFVQLVVYFSVILGEIYFYCYYGSTLSEESDALTTAVYMSNWYEFDMRSKRALMVLMERSRNPIVLTSGKIISLSLETFTTILKRSYSLLAVLKNYS